jgi:hypothetical protein
MPPAARSRTAAHPTRDDATSAGAAPDDVPGPQTASHVHGDAGIGS